MRYIDEINSFYQWLLTNNISTSSRMLWFALMQMCNTNGWKKEFNVPIQTLELLTGMSKDSIIRARNVLQQNGRISFYSRGGRQSAVYSIISFESFKATQNATQPTTQYTTQSATQPTTQSTTIHKNRVDKTKLESKPKKTTSRFIPPTREEVIAYAKERNSVVDPDYFCDYYESLNWMRGKTKMKDWKATFRNWERNDYNGTNRKSNTDTHRTTQTAGGGKPDKWDNETDEW